MHSPVDSPDITRHRVRAASYVTERPEMSGRRIACALVVAELAACSNAGVLDPQGPVGAAERLILFNATAIMLVVAVPVIALTLAFAWWYRASNVRAQHRPDWAYSGKIELVVWAIPAMVVILLAGVGWIGAHRLDPGVELKSGVAPVRIQVVSFDWKWLFIYPDEGVAAVNRIVVPAGAPIRFELTSASVMNAFFVPQLGSQIYTMAGMATRLNLMADRPGDYPGLSSHFSGAGFSDMRFVLHAVPEAEFKVWVAQTRASAPALDAAAAERLAVPSRSTPLQTYRTTGPGLFERILEQAAPMCSASAPST